MFSVGFTLRGLYVIFQIIGTVILVGELIYVAFQKPSKIQKYLIYILFTVLISTIGYLIELIAMGDGTVDPDSALRTAYIGCALGYIGKPFALVASMLLVFEYANIRIDKRFVFLILIYFLFLSLMVVTNPYHHLYYTYAVIDNTKTGSPLDVGHGPFWYVYIISSIFVFLSYIFVGIYEYKKCKNSQAKHMSIFMLLVFVFAFLGLVLFMTGATKNYDTTMLGIEIGTIILLILFTKYKIFDSLTLAETKAMYDSKDGYVVLDARNRITYYNKIAMKIIPLLSSSYKISNHEKSIETLEQFKEGEPIELFGKVYSLEISTATVGKANRMVGKTYIFKEITIHHNYQKQLTEEVNSATEKILSIQRKALGNIADIVEARDGNTGTHIKSVSYTARKIAEQLAKDSPYKRSLTPTMINIIEDCAPLHDIGKIYISDTILQKPGKLTPEEFEIIKTHSVMGGKIIEKVFAGIEEPMYVRIATNIATGHHERFDGTGYPNQLKGTNIPLCARILAVADVYDALRMKRPYKEPYSKKESIEIIKQESGTHFDPVIVDAFLAITQDLK